MSSLEYNGAKGLLCNDIYLRLLNEKKQRLYADSFQSRLTGIYLSKRPYKSKLTKLMLHG